MSNTTILFTQKDAGWKAGMPIHDEHRVRISTPDGRRFDECEFYPAHEIYAKLGLGKYMAGLDFRRPAHAACRGDVLHGARTCRGVSNV